MDHIKVGVKGNDRIADIVLANREKIAAKVLADEIAKEVSYANEKEWNINGEKVLISVEKNE